MKNAKYGYGRIANYMDETGYPFAQVYLDSATIGDGFIVPGSPYYRVPGYILIR